MLSSTLSILRARGHGIGLSLHARPRFRFKMPLSGRIGPWCASSAHHIRASQRYLQEHSTMIFIMSAEPLLPRWALIYHHLTSLRWADFSIAVKAFMDLTLETRMTSVQTVYIRDVTAVRRNHPQGHQVDMPPAHRSRWRHQPPNIRMKGQA